MLAVASATTASAGFVSGDLDIFFGVDRDGRATTHFGEGATDEINGLVMLKSGKLIAAGTTEPQGGDPDFALAAYEPYGGLDASDFGNGGTRTTDFNGGFDRAWAIATTPDSNLVVAGEAAVGPNAARSVFAVARYKPNGKLDRSFGGDGRVTTELKRGGGFEQARGVVVRPDATITVAGVVEKPSGGSVFGLVRYRENGRRDKTFSRDGRVTTRFPGGEEHRAWDIVAGPRGSVIVAGDSGEFGARSFALARYLSNGTLDSSFGGDGRVLSALDGSSTSGHTLLIQPADRKIVVGGSAGGEDAWAIARFRRNGALDGSFNGTGYEIETLGATGESIEDLAIKDNGRIYATGWANQDMTVARYLANGGLDSNFAGDGTNSVDFFGLFDAASAIVLQGEQEKPVLAGGAGRPDDDDAFGLARFFG